MKMTDLKWLHYKKLYIVVRGDSEPIPIIVLNKYCNYNKPIPKISHVQKTTELV